MKEKNKEKIKEVKQKKHFNPARGAVRIIALLLAIAMLLTASATLIYMLVYSI